MNYEKEVRELCEVAVLYRRANRREESGERPTPPLEVLNLALFNETFLPLAGGD